MITIMICVEWCFTRYPTKIFVTDVIYVRLAPYSIHNYPYLYSRTSVFVFVFKDIRIRIRIRIKIWKQIWFHWYPPVFDPIAPLCTSKRATESLKKQTSIAEVSPHSRVCYKRWDQDMQDTYGFKCCWFFEKTSSIA
jgi:hypothetical protein